MFVHLMHVAVVSLDIMSMDVRNAKSEVARVIGTLEDSSIVLHIGMYIVNGKVLIRKMM